VSVPDLHGRLASCTLEMVRIDSVSRHEHMLLDHIRSLFPTAGPFDVLDDADAALFFGPSERRDDRPFIVLAGHVDTVPAAGVGPARQDGETIHGRGAADMKGGLAVMLELATAIASGTSQSPRDIASDVGFLFFGREEIPIADSALLPMLERCRAAADIDLAIVLEPTGNTIEVGCLGNLDARVSVRGEPAHTARPWHGSNAIHGAIEALAPLAELPVRDVEIEGLVYREVASVTMIEGGSAPNVVPGLVQARVNFRYAPDRTPDEAEARLRELVVHPAAEVEVVSNAPPGPVVLSHPLVDRLHTDQGLQVRPKQAWTPVAEFAMAGVDAINLGPGEPRYAHREDEKVEVAALVRTFDILGSFLGIGPSRQAAKEVPSA
jgi:succinyl-diaminopimelate desuccinylase